MTAVHCNFHAVNFVCRWLRSFENAFKAVHFQCLDFSYPWPSSVHIILYFCYIIYLSRYKCISRYCWGQFQGSPMFTKFQCFIFGFRILTSHVLISSVFQIFLVFPVGLRSHGYGIMSQRHIGSFLFMSPYVCQFWFLLVIKIRFTG